MHHRPFGTAADNKLRHVAASNYSVFTFDICKRYADLPTLQAEKLRENLLMQTKKTKNTVNKKSELMLMRHVTASV